MLLFFCSSGVSSEPLQCVYGASAGDDRPLTAKFFNWLSFFVLQLEYVPRANNVSRETFRTYAFGE